MGDKYTVKSDLSVAAKHATAIGSANNYSAITVQRDEQTTVAGNNSAKMVLVNLRIFRLSYRIIL